MSHLRVYLELLRVNNVLLIVKILPANGISVFILFFYFLGFLLWFFFMRVQSFIMHDATNLVFGHLFRMQVSKPCLSRQLKLAEFPTPVNAS